MNIDIDIDIELLKKQKSLLISMISEGDLGLPEECKLLEGLVHMLGAIQAQHEAEREAEREKLIQSDIDMCKHDPHYLADMVAFAYQDWTCEMIEKEFNLRGLK